MRLPSQTSMPSLVQPAEFNMQVGYANHWRSQLLPIPQVTSTAAASDLEGGLGIPRPLLEDPVHPYWLSMQ